MNLYLLIMTILQPPPEKKPMMRLPPDPTFDEIKEAGGVPELHDEAHAVSNGQVWISGEISRTAEWENGLLFSIQWIGGGWQSDEVRLFSYILLELHRNSGASWSL